MERLIIIATCVTLWYAVGLLQFLWFAYDLDEAETVKPPDRISNKQIYLGALVGPLPVLYFLIVSPWSRLYMFLFEK